ncbi:MAG: diaminopimelate epimerase [Elusimicrobiaceae bacterium]|nr:diaminopimelate epimerase [Elusimicrobiaceae bacterium]
MQFTKYNGLGNDFVFLDEQTALSVKNPTVLAQKMCDRRLGIGADGLVLLLPSARADVRMRIINSDGSEAEMCGNASRCVPLHLYRRGMCKNKKISLETLAGIIRTEIIDESCGLVRVDMGAPRLRRTEIPILGAADDRAVGVPVGACGRTFFGTALSMGNPHFVVFVEDAENIPLEQWGPALETHKLFPRKTNVEFVQVLNKYAVRMRVWERGAGVTRACGTGACAAAVAGVLNNKTAEKITVKLDGGDLQIEWPDQQHVWMTGLAQEVFTGDYIDL